ncbi:MAG: DNA polymerase III subunit beta [Clostridia bacterium]|nr:DNA polymerase III subunit beta [Clostridia bacterium]
MKIYCNKDEIERGVNIVSKAVSSKSSVPYLESVLLEAEDERLYLTGNDLEICIKTSVPCNISEEGSIVLNCKMLSDIIRKLPNDVCEIKTEESAVVISCVNSDYRIVGLDANEYPAVPDIEVRSSIRVPSPVLKDMISRTSFAVSQKQDRKVLTGSLFEIEDNTLTIVAVDGYRMAIRKEKLEGECKNGKFIIPGKAENEVIKIMSDDEEDIIEVGFCENYAVFENDSFNMITRLIDGEFFAYKQVLPSEFKINTKVETAGFKNTISRVEPIIDDVAKNPVRLKLTEDGLKIMCRTPLGRVNDKFDVSYDGKDFEIGFNYRYLYDAVSRCGDESTVLRMNTPLNPMIISGEDNDSYLFMVLPVQLS